MAATVEAGRSRQAADRAFEIFVKRAINGIHKESWGRSKESKDVKDSCQQFLTLLEQHETGAVPYEGSLALAVLQPLMLACGSSNVKIVELALGALHKLVAHAWLQGESSTSEDLLVDGTDIVTRVIKQVIKCGEISNPTLQLSVIRALLTFTTAEHFVAHGDSLMSAVRAVFNLALGSESEDIKRTACNALLQILNTVAKRVTAYFHSLSLASSRRESEHDSVTWAAKEHEHSLQQHNSVQSASGQLAGAPAPRPVGTGVASQLTPKNRSLANSTDGTHAALDARTAQLAQLAEQHDIRGLEAALGGGAVLDSEQGAGSAGSPVGTPDAAAVGALNSPPGVQPATPLQPDSTGGLPPGDRGKSLDEPVVQLTVTERDVLLVLTAFCKLASREAGLTEVESYLHQGKLLALELLVKVLQNPQHRWENVRDAFTRHLRQPLCITLLRNWAANDPSAFQLAIKLLLAVMMQPKLRAGLKAELGAFYPLFVLLPLEQGCGNAAAGVAGSGVGANSPAGQGKPLLEQTDLHTLYIVLSNLKQLCGDVQLVVDLFVNYDCDAQAPPLFERTMKVLGLIAQRTDVSDKDRAATPNQPAAKQQAEALARLAAVRDAALKCISATIQSIGHWAAPLREQQHQQLTPSSDTNGHHGPQDAHAESAAAEAGHAAEQSPGALARSSQGGSQGGSEAERLEAVWAHKSSLAKGLAMFNTSPLKGIKYLVQQGLVEKNPHAVAVFLRAHAADVDKAALGEYMGHHESFQVSVMHALIDQERYAGIGIDAALRRLLCQFRLPGEAQKIDRIMEKFAERFYLDNPGQFRNADGPYLLSFAIIMLNTDAHNPLAERRLGKPDFVAMCHQTLSEEEGGGMAPVLDPLLLEGIFERIVADEIVMTDPDARQAQPKQQTARGGPRAKLASALGLYALAAPFKPLTRNWGKAAQDLPDAERKRGLLELAERAIIRGVGSGWVTALHCELCRPMLTVGAAAVMDALQAGLGAAAVPSTAEPLLATLVLVAQLAALLRLDEVCERAVGVLAAACKVESPGAHMSSQEAKQLAALKTLLSLTSMPDVGSLGSAWVVLLRTVSALNSLTADLLQPDEPPMPAQPAVPSAVASPFNKMFQAWGISLGGAQPIPTSAVAPRAPSVSTPVMLLNGAAESGASKYFIRPAPGAALVDWALTDGKAAVEQLFSISALLDGEAVVVYFRALCAVSSEELDLAHPRTSFLQRLVQCAHANTDRIRLIWGKLWAIISAHLVAASCHISQPVAMFSVDALRGLATKLLSRAELAHFRAQEEALAPFVAVLRQSDDPEVRDATVAHLTQAVAAQPHGLGSGWRTLLDALARAGADTSSHVVTRAVHTLALPVRALYAAPLPSGHGYVVECVRAAVTTAQNRAATQQAGVAAVQLLQVCAAQLRVHGAAGALVSAPSNSQATPAVGTTEHFQTEAGTLASAASASLGSFASADAGMRLDSWALLLSSLADIIQQQDSRPLVANAASHAVMAIMQEHNPAWSEGAWQVLLTRIVPALFNPSLHESQPHTSAPVPPKAGQEAHAAASMPSPEFVARAQHFFPLMCDQVSKAQSSYQSELLGQLAKTALHWLQQIHEPLIKCGLAGYEQLLEQTIKAQDLTSTQRLLGLLQPVLQSQLITVMAATHAAQHRSASAGGAWPAALASSSHMLLLAHRVLARLHSTHWPALPWPLQAQLLEPMASCARQCMLFNQTLEIEACHQLGNGKLPHGESISMRSTTPSNGRPNSHNTHEALPQHAPAATQPTPASAATAVSPAESRPTRQSSDQDEVAADCILEADTPAVTAGVRPSADPLPSEPSTGTASHSQGNFNVQVELPPTTSHPGGSNASFKQSPLTSRAGAQAKHQSAAQDGRMQVSLLRLEMEAARCVIDALEICLQGRSSEAAAAGKEIKSPQGNGGNQNEALHMLHGMCLDIIKQGAVWLTQSLQTRLGSDSACMLPDGAHTEHGQVHVTPGWLADARAPLLARAVLVVATAPGAQEIQFVRALFPHLLVVMCSHQPMVREAVAVYFSQAVQPLIMGKA